MNKKGPIVVIDDDADDLELYKETFRKIDLKNPLHLFQTAPAALDFLRSSDKPFLLLSDVNLPVQNGFELRETIRKEPELIETDASPNAIRKAYMLSVQGIFQKPSTVREWEEMLKEIVTYWLRCMS